MTKPIILIGWREWVALPELDVPFIKAKVDTGARTSSLHAENIRLLRRGGKQLAEFTIHPRQRSKKIAVQAVAPVVDERRVTSSSGDAELRPVIKTTVDIGGLVWSVEITLTHRDEMGFRMLLGREAIRGHALVDPARSYLTRKIKKKAQASSSR